MAHDAQREDYLRMSLRFALELDGADPAEAARAFASFGRRLAQDRDSLPQSDADRAFHLVALASDVIDRQLPFAGDAQAEELIRRGRTLLDEALSLDASCWDALRMRSSSQIASIDERYRFLVENESAVRSDCEAERDRLVETLDGDRALLGASIAMRPYWRWLASMAEEALICGRNRAAVDAAERLLASDPSDLSDVRFTLAYALAKLEDGAGLARLRERYATLSPLRPADDAWILLAEVALAHKRCDFSAAREGLARLLASYPGCGFVLIRQSELPDGEFARLRVPPYGEDELIIAASEGVVLLQEGNDRSGKGVLGSWVARTVAQIDPGSVAEAERIARGEGGQRQ